VYVSNSNPINAFSNSNKGHEALQKPEFIVVHEQFMTSTAKYADILLPVNSHLEREDIAGAWMMSPPTLFYINKAVDSAYESKTDLEICTELAMRLGIPEFNDKTEEEWLREISDALPAIDNFDQFKESGFLKIEPPEPHVALKDQIDNPEEHRFRTPSGKIEIYSQTIADLNNPLLPPIPRYIDPWEGPNDPLTEKYPLQLISVHTKTRVKSQFDNIPWLREIEPQQVWINTVDASNRNIQNGDKVYVYNDRGKVLTQCKVTERIMPGVISMADGAWYNPDENGVDIGGCQNTLAKDTMSPAGAFPYNNVLAQVEKA
jgi:anaerobic dimethyl sulfoxide reductase subunit A